MLAYALVALALLVVGLRGAAGAQPRPQRVRAVSHRFGGWTAIALFWALTVHLALRGRGDAAALEAIASDWHVWVLALLTASVASPWLRLRRVPVTVERPSSHAAIVRFDYGVTPAFASAVGISRSPLREWHAFATVTTPGQSGYRLLDLPRRRLDRALHRRSAVARLGARHPGLAPMAKVALLYERVVYVVTGSGIGPCLGQILAARVPARLVWSTRDPARHLRRRARRRGRAAQPDAVDLGHDQARQARPRAASPAEAYEDFDAEAVFVVSNKPTTLRLVHDLERLASRPSGRSGTPELAATAPGTRGFAPGARCSFVRPSRT